MVESKKKLNVRVESKKKMKVMDADKWSTLPDDLLVDIFRRLDVVSAVIRCAAACRPWRRAIINAASCLRPRPDCFLPDLPLGFLENHLRSRRHLPWKLQYVPASSNSTTVPSPNFLVPATGVCVDGRLYSHLLSSRDGFLLLGEDNDACDSLCLCTAAHTGVCRVLPAAEFDDNCSMRCMYVLATGYDYDYSTSDNGGVETAVWILAVDWQRFHGTITYQIFSSTTTAAAWGPVKRLAKFPEDVARVLTSPSASVVCHGAVSWLVYLFPDRNDLNRRIRKCIFSIDLRTERTWTTELPPPPPPDHHLVITEEESFVLAVSKDGGRLSLVKMLSCSHQMEVWVLVGDGDQWTLRRKINDVQKLLPSCPSMGHMQVSGFCPRSGYLFGTGRDDRNVEHHFLIGVDGSSPRLIGRVDPGSRASRFPYEMDSSTYISSYISKMKYF